MNTKTAKENQETELNLSVRTGLAHRNKFEEAHTQIDYTSYYLGSIFYFMRVALEAENLLELQTETKAFNNDAQFRENMQFLIQIGESFCEWLPDYAGVIKDCSDLIDKGKETKQEASSDAPEVGTETDDDGKFTGDLEIDNLALSLSGVLNNEKLPVEMYNGIKRALDDVFNELAPEANDELTSYQDSPEYLAKLIQYSK